MSMTQVSEPQTYAEKLRAERRVRQAKWFPKKVVVAIVTVPDVVIHLSPDEYQHVLRMREDATAIPITMPNSIKRIVQAVSDLYEISFVDMLSCRWTKNGVARPRQILGYLCRTLTTYSLAEIGRHLGRDYSTVAQRHATIARLRKLDRELNDELNWLEGQLAG
jgi:chromosomal replication initiation ATPase DnaA